MEELVLDAGLIAVIAAAALFLVVCGNGFQRRRQQRKLSAAFYRARSFRTQGVTMLAGGLES